MARFGATGYDTSIHLFVCTEPIMILTIDPKVDYAFKRLFGSPGHESLLIDLINAVLLPYLQAPIISITVLNPFDEKSYAEDKLSILDIKARDQDGRLYNIEMQIRVNDLYPPRALYYWAGVYHSQLQSNDNYTELRPTIAIHIVNGRLHPEEEDHHLLFEVRERRRPHLLFSPHFQLHLIELPKFVQRMEQIQSPLDRWCYLFRHGEGLDTTQLTNNFYTPIMQQAMEVLTTMSQNPQERERYESRLKAQRDYDTGIAVARLEGRGEGERLGLLNALEFGMEVKFGSVDTEIMNQIREITDLPKLRGLLSVLRAATTVEEFRSRIGLAS